MVNTIPRFVLDDKRNVIDVLNSNGQKGYCHEGAPDTQIDLRERLLIVRLGDLVDDLIASQPRAVEKWGRKYRPFSPDGLSIWHSLYSLIRATHLHALDPAVALEKRSAGELKRDKVGLQSFTSLSLFTDDVERLLRDLYGDVEALDRIVRAVFVLVDELTQYAHRGLWQEHQDAVACDYIHGVGVPDGYGISSSQWGDGMSGAAALRLRARDVREAPSNFSKYTVEFATKHIGNFIGIKETLPSDDELPF